MENDTSRNSGEVSTGYQLPESFLKPRGKETVPKLTILDIHDGPPQEDGLPHGLPFFQVIQPNNFMPNEPPHETQNPPQTPLCREYGLADLRVGFAPPAQMEADGADAAVSADP